MKMTRDLTPAQTRCLLWLLEQANNGIVSEEFFAKDLYGGIGLVMAGVSMPDSVKKDFGTNGLVALVHHGYLLQNGDMYSFTRKALDVSQEEDADSPTSIVLYHDLRKKMVAAFSLSELRLVCDDIGIDPENIRHETKEILAQEMLLWSQRNQRMPALLIMLKKLRPVEDWEI